MSRNFHSCLTIEGRRQPVCDRWLSMAKRGAMLGDSPSRGSGP
jgi:hypothetical protein